MLLVILPSPIGCRIHLSIDLVVTDRPCDELRLVELQALLVPLKTKELDETPRLMLLILDQ